MNNIPAEQIHHASLALLQNPGVRLEHDAVCNRVLRAGAGAGTDTNVVRIPEPMVTDALQSAPNDVFFADRRGTGYSVGSGSQRTPRIWSVPGMNIWTRNGVRLFTSQDMSSWSRLLDRLPRVDGVFGMSMDDVPPTGRDVVGLRIMAENTTRHIRVLCFTPAGADVLCRMREIVSPDPWFSVGFTAHGPLRWTHLALEIFSRTANHGIPTTINGEPMAGVSGPVTLAGTAAVGNAEILAGLVVNQILEPGRPCIYNLGLAHAFDMRTAVALTGAPENHLLAGVSGIMGRFYDLPSCSWVSTESMCPDSQAALEKAIGYFTHSQNGVNLIWGIGQLESELTVSPAQAVIDNEIIGYTERVLRGFRTNDETLAVDIVRDVGIAGDFLGTEVFFYGEREHSEDDKGDEQARRKNAGQRALFNLRTKLGS